MAESSTDFAKQATKKVLMIFCGVHVSKVLQEELEVQQSFEEFSNFIPTQ
jgi:hypothetical protein